MFELSFVFKTHYFTVLKYIFVVIVLCFLLINARISISDIYITGSEYVETGDQIRLTCIATGVISYPDDLDWFKDGHELQTDVFNGVNISKSVDSEAKAIRSDLVIYKSNLEDIGIYVCRSSDLAIASVRVQVLISK